MRGAMRGWTDLRSSGERSDPGDSGNQTDGYSIRPTPPAGSLCSPGLRGPRLRPPPRQFRLHPLELRQLVPEPGELPLGVMAGVGAADFGGLFAADLAGEMADQRGHAMGLHRRKKRIEL